MAPEIKIGRIRIEIISFSNAREWIRKVSALLKGEGYWTPIQTVIDDRDAAEAQDKIKESTLTHEKLTEDGEKKASKVDWQKLNYQAISILLSIIPQSDQQAVENLEYAGDIWLYVTKKYSQANYSTLTAAFASYFRWERNESHSIEEAAREIEYFANRIPQLKGPKMDMRITKFLFLRGLPGRYESARQTLESQDLSMEEMIMRLTEIEARLKKPESGAGPGPEDETLIMNEAAARAREKKKQRKKVRCFNCGKRGHYARDCDEESSEASDSEPSEDEKPRKGKKSDNKKKVGREKARTYFACESDLDSA